MLSRYCLMIPQADVQNLSLIPEKLYNSLKHFGIECIELIPGRNDSAILKNFVRIFS